MQLLKLCVVDSVVVETMFYSVVVAFIDKRRRCNKIDHLIAKSSGIRLTHDGYRM